MSTMIFGMRSNLIFKWTWISVAALNLENNTFFAGLKDNETLQLGGGRVGNVKSINDAINIAALSQQ